MPRIVRHISHFVKAYYHLTIAAPCAEIADQSFKKMSDLAEHAPHNDFSIVETAKKQRRMISPKGAMSQRGAYFLSEEAPEAVNVGGTTYVRSDYLH